MLIECPNCGNKVAKGKKFCSKCGTPIASLQGQADNNKKVAEVFCTNCGSKVAEEVKFCGQCGNPVGQASQKTNS